MDEKTVGDMSPSSDQIPARSGYSFSKSRLQTLTRLIIGGIEFGLDELLQNVSKWEDKIVSQSSDDTSSASLPSNENENISEAVKAEKSIETESSLDLVRFAIIGWIFETQEKLDERFSNLQRFENWVIRKTSPYLSPLFNNSLTKPFLSRFEALEQRGEEEIKRWIEIGRREEVNSKILANTAYRESIDGFIDYLTANPEVKELVQTQSSSLANEMIEEVRERTVSADTFLEGVARSILRRAPRSDLPEPPVEIRSSFLTPRSIKNRIK